MFYRFLDPMNHLLDIEKPLYDLTFLSRRKTMICRSCWTPSWLFLNYQGLDTFWKHWNLSHRYIILQPRDLFFQHLLLDYNVELTWLLITNWWLVLGWVTTKDDHTCLRIAGKSYIWRIIKFYLQLQLLSNYEIHLPESYAMISFAS